MIAATRPAAPGVFLSVCKAFVWLTLLLTIAPHAQAQTTYTGTVNFGAVNVGVTSVTQTITFNFSSPTALNVAKPVQVLTQGATGLDFKSTGTGTCADFNPPLVARARHSSQNSAGRSGSQL